MKLTFEPSGGGKQDFADNLLDGYRIAFWLPFAGSAKMQVACQFLFHQENPTVKEDLPGTSQVTSIMTNGGPLPPHGNPGVLTVSDGGTGLSLTFRGFHLHANPSQWFGPNGVYAILLEFSSGPFTSNKLATECRIEASFGDLDDTMPDVGKASCGLFEWLEPDGFVADEQGKKAPGELKKMFKPILHELDSSGSVIAFRTKRTKYNDPVSMLLRQLCAQTPSLTLNFKRSAGQEGPQSQVFGPDNLKGILYEQVWGKYKSLEPWTSSTVSTRMEQLLKELDLSTVLRASRETPVQAGADIEERLAFVLPNDFDWPPMSEVIPPG